MIIFENSRENKDFLNQQTEIFVHKMFCKTLVKSKIANVSFSKISLKYKFSVCLVSLFLNSGERTNQCGV